MKEETFNNLKNKYDEFIEKNNKNKKRLEVMTERMNLLENSVIVKQYLELKEKIKKYEKIIVTEDDILNSTLEYCSDDLKQDNNQIYIYLGSYIYDQHNNELQIRDETENFSPNYNLYGNLETKEFFSIDFNDRKKFEEENTVIYTNLYPSINDFYDIRNNFFKDLIYNGQQQATAKVLKRNIKK